MIRPLIALLRGKASPTQVFLAGLLGGLIGFVPSLSTSGGLLLLYVVLLLVLNANIGLCMLIAGGAKLISLLAMPLSFSIGRFLLEGPTEGLFRGLVNGPVTAWLGLEHYVTSGGLVLGAVVGLLAGGSLAKTLSAWRNRMASIEAGSEKFTKVTQSWWSRLVMWFVVGGGHGKKTYTELAQKKKGPIRIAGVAVSAVLLAVVFFAPSLLSGSVLAGATRSGLESWNGATVDVADVTLDVAGGSLSITGLAMADPNELDTDFFRAARLEADVGTADLLRKKLTIERLVVVDGENGAARASPGVLVGPPPEPAPETDEEAEDAEAGGGKSLDEYLEDAEVWKERLAQVREWLDSMASEEDETDAGDVDEETLRDRLEREVAAKGYAAVVARHLVEDAPTLLIRELVAGGVRSASFEGEQLDIQIDNLSTNPSLVDEPVRLSIASQAGSLDVDIGLGGSAASADANTLRFILNGVAAESVAGSLQVDGKPVLSGGTLDFKLDGEWENGQVGRVDLPVHVTLHDCVVQLPTGARQVDTLTLPFGIRGPLDDPRVTFDDKALQDALLASAKAEVQAVVDEKTAELEAKAAEEQAELEAKLAEEAAEAQQKAEDEISGALGGLFGDDDDEKKKKKKKKKNKNDAPEDG